MIRFALFLFMSLALSSKAVAAVVKTVRCLGCLG